MNVVMTKLADIRAGRRPDMALAIILGLYYAAFVVFGWYASLLTLCLVPVAAMLRTSLLQKQGELSVPRIAGFDALFVLLFIVVPVGLLFLNGYLVLRTVPIVPFTSISACAIDIIKEARFSLYISPFLLLYVLAFALADDKYEGVRSESIFKRSFGLVFCWVILVQFFAYLITSSSFATDIIFSSGFIAQDLTRQQMLQAYYECYGLTVAIY